jgi:hypothetical protein
MAGDKARTFQELHFVPKRSLKLFENSAGIMGISRGWLYGFLREKPERKTGLVPGCEMNECLARRLTPKV